MAHSEELNRIDAAIAQRNLAELQWAHDYCRTQMRAAIPNENKGHWKSRQREVSRVLRDLVRPKTTSVLTSGQATIAEHSEKARLAAASTAWRSFRRVRSKTGPTMMTRHSVLNAELIRSSAQFLDIPSSARFFRRCTITGSSD
jgi:hypothetical protein